MDRAKKYLMEEITIEQAVKKLITTWESDEATTIEALHNIISINYAQNYDQVDPDNSFYLFYKKDETTIHNKESEHIESFMWGVTACKYLLGVANHGWDEIYVNPFDYGDELIIKTKDENGSGIAPKEVTVKYAVAPLPFKEFELKIDLLEEMLNENNMPIPKYWGDDNSEGTQDPQDGTDWGNDWGDITIIITKQGTLILENKKNGKVKNIHPSVLGLCPTKSMNQNKRYKILGSMLNNKPVKVNKGTATNISRLGKSLRDYFNIDSKPFYINNKRYYPVFNIESQQENQDGRLEKAAAISGKTKSYEQMTDPEIARLAKEQEEDEKSTHYTPTKRRP